MLKKNQLTMLLALLLFLNIASAMSLFDLRTDTLMMRTPELKKILDLNANQQILWQQCENKTNSMLRAKSLRQIKIDQAVRDMIQKPNVELRDIEVRLSDEKRASNLDEQMVREIWLTMFDALNDTQRLQVQNFLSEQLQESGNPDRSNTEKPETMQRKGRGMSHNPGGSGATNSF